MRRYYIGFSISTASLAVFGVGTAVINKSVRLQDIQGEGDAGPYFVSDVQKDFGAYCRPSSAAGFGISHRLAKSAFHFSAKRCFHRIVIFDRIWFRYRTPVFQRADWIFQLDHGFFSSFGSDEQNRNDHDEPGHLSCEFR